MKKLFYALIVGVLFLGCTQQVDDFTGLFKTNGPEFPSHIEKYGKELAKSIKQTVAVLNERGADYSDANYSKEFYDRFHSDWLGAASTTTRSPISMEQIEISPLVLAEKYQNLTPVQLKFIDRIKNEGSQSSSYEEFCAIIKNINEDISTEVPKIEQERLFYITSSLYYGLSEIYHLQLQGQMLTTAQTNLGFAMVKTRSESDGGGSFWESCKMIYEATCTYVVGAVLATGEVVSSITLKSVVTATGTVMMYVVLLCLTGDTSEREQLYRYCQDELAKCVPQYPPYQDPCTRCYEYCMSNGYWPKGASMGCW